MVRSQVRAISRPWDFAWVRGTGVPAVSSRASHAHPPVLGRSAALASPLGPILVRGIFPLSGDKWAICGADRTESAESRCLKRPQASLAQSGVHSPPHGCSPHARRRAFRGGARAKPPTDLRIVKSSSATLTLSWNAGRSSEAQRFELYADAKSVGSTAEQEFTFTGLSCGIAAVLSVEALDTAGRRSEPAHVIAAPATCRAATPPKPAAVPHASAPAPPEVPRTTEPSHTVDVPSTRSEPNSVPQGGAETESDEISWAGAGAFVWHENDVAPESLGLQLRENGFSWVAVLIHDGMSPDPIEADWVARFRTSSGLPVGGWGVLRTQPEPGGGPRESTARGLLARLLRRESRSGVQVQRRRWFEWRAIRSFATIRRLVPPAPPEMPVALSSYCRADTQDIDWEAWNRSGFAFLPQAYVNDFGEATSPAACAEGAADYFPADAVHPTVGVYAGQDGEPSPARYAELLDKAGTVGFSVYLAETRMRVEQWRMFGEAMVELAIARRPGDELTTGDGPPTRMSPADIS